MDIRDNSILEKWEPRWIMNVFHVCVFGFYRFISHTVKFASPSTMQLSYVLSYVHYRPYPVISLQLKCKLDWGVKLQWDTANISFPTSPCDVFTTRSSGSLVVSLRWRLDLLLGCDEGAMRINLSSCAETNTNRKWKTQPNTWELCFCSMTASPPRLKDGIRSIQLHWSLRCVGCHTFNANPLKLSLEFY